MNMSRFGAHIKTLREEKGYSRTALASKLNVTETHVERWENGESFPLLDELRTLATVLDTTIDNIFDACEDGIKRVCIANIGYKILKIAIDEAQYTIGADESKWVELGEKTAFEAHVCGEPQDDYKITEDGTESKGEKLVGKLLEKGAKAIDKLSLIVDCTYKIENITPNSLLSIQCERGMEENDSLTNIESWISLEIMDITTIYPKIKCRNDIKVKLLAVRPQNRSKAIRRNLWVTVLFGEMIYMLPFLPFISIYYRYKCKPQSIKRDIEADNPNYITTNQGKKEKRTSSSRGCLISLLIMIAVIAAIIITTTVVIPIIFIESEKPYLIAADYSTIQFEGKTFVRIEKLPETAVPKKTLWATIWEDVRTDGLSRYEQYCEDNMVQLFEDSDGKEYLWFVENYTELDSDIEYEDFKSPYVYMWIPD